LFKHSKDGESFVVRNEKKDLDVRFSIIVCVMRVC